jgi:hypothetical protein
VLDQFTINILDLFLTPYFDENGGVEQSFKMAGNVIPIYLAFKA